MNGPRGYYASKISQTEKDKYCIYGIENTKQVNKHNKTETEVDMQRTNKWLPEGKE